MVMKCNFLSSLWGECSKKSSLHSGVKNERNHVPSRRRRRLRSKLLQSRGLGGSKVAELGSIARSRFVRVKVTMVRLVLICCRFKGRKANMVLHVFGLICIGYAGLNLDCCRQHRTALNAGHLDRFWTVLQVVFAGLFLSGFDCFNSKFYGRLDKGCNRF
ncbi:unnamed protein product [Vicia faba]|uniref:Uncharacterized protein n=1 Tax=Vicia faba TaxID=3906 RepID=A0AAV0ZA86_VICFA|nr:unnamed protein product [Vicia faba]